MSQEMIVQSAPLVSYADMEKMATVIAQSGLFGVKNPTQALALMLLSQAEGLHPVMAARDYHIIQGRPTLKADAMMARFQQAGGKVEWHSYEDTDVSATFSHPAGGKVRIEWTFEQAKRAGLTGKEVWKQYPRAMLRARVISEGIRTVYPGVLSGMYTPEEVRDITGEAETSGPTPRQEPVAPTPEPVDYDAVIRGFTDKTEMRQWLAGVRTANGWQPKNPVYESMKAACAERAAEIDAEAKRLAEVQAADDFDAGLGLVEDMGEPA
jgi:hypothetical protein